MGSTTPTSTEHRYQSCHEPDCQRFPCRAYREGQRDGYQDGHRRGLDDGYTAGYSDGYSKGYTAGQAACPLPHQ